jgi:hypothetical protein
VESVAWVSQRKNVLAMTFFLLAFLQYASYRECGQAKVRHYLLSLIALALALLTKSVAIVFPLAAILYDACLVPPPTRRNFADKAPYIVLAAAISVIALASQAQNAGGGRRGYPGGSKLTTFFTMVPVLPSYIADCFFPAKLSPYYNIPIRIAPDTTFAVGLLCWVLLAWLGWWLYRRQRRIFFFYALFFIGLLPVSQIVPLIPFKNDRYLYFPLIGFAGLCGECLALLARRSPPWRQVSAMAAVAILLMLPLLSFRQTRIWENDITLWQHAVSLDPDNRVGWLLLAKGLTLRGHGAEALAAVNRYNQLKARWGPPRGWERE